MTYIEYEHAYAGKVAIIRLNRPERLNALSPEAYAELRATFDRFLADDEAWVGVITGTGRAFCAGRDLKAQAERGHITRPTYTRTWNIFGMPETDKPLIAAVNGYAIGAGWYMAAGCDIRVAAESAQFGMGEIPTGLLGPYWFPVAEVLPWAIGCELTLVGDRISAHRALGLGLVNEVVPDGEALTAALRWAEKLLALPPHQVRRTKALMQIMRTVPREAMIAKEMEARDFLNQLEDTNEAARAFAEKRQPVFHGR